MATLKCRCGFDSLCAKPEGSYHVGTLAQQSGMTWVMLQDGVSVWLCGTCAGRVHELARKITEILGSDMWVASSVMPCPSARR